MVSSNQMEWKEVHDSISRKEIGALCIVDGTVVAVASFIDDRDGNHDGEVSRGEKFASFISFMRLNGRAAVYVASQAYADPDLLVAHPELYNVRGQLVAKFGARAVMDGVYAAYFKRPVSMLGKGVASRLTSSAIKSFAIRKGFESQAKKAFQAAMP